MCRNDLAIIQNRPIINQDCKPERRRLDKLFKVLPRQELALRSYTENSIGRIEFLKFFNLPGLLSEQLFNSLDHSGTEALNCSSFTAGIVTLYRGSQTYVY